MGNFPCTLSARHRCRRLRRSHRQGARRSHHATQARQGRSARHSVRPPARRVSGQRERNRRQRTPDLHPTLNRWPATRQHRTPATAPPNTRHAAASAAQCLGWQIVPPRGPARHRGRHPLPVPPPPPPGIKESVSRGTKAGLWRGATSSCGTSKFHAPLRYCERFAIRIAATSHGYWGFYLSNDRLNLH